MILSVTLNPCIDKTIYLDHFKTGAYNRVQRTRADMAGKGLNVSTALHYLGEDTLCMGFNFNGNGAQLDQILDKRGVKHSFTYVDGEIRTNIKLFDLSCQSMTEINESGTSVPPDAVRSLLEKVDAALCNADILVMSGSIPPGVPTDIYGQLIRMARKKQVKTVLDAAGEPLLLGLKEKPSLIKPNSLEFSQAFHIDPETAPASDTINAARRAINSGIPWICISMGEKGAMFVDREHAYRAKALPLEAKGLTGAGDSMVAGMCYAIRRQLSCADMLRYAMATAGGSIRREGTLLAQKEDVEELLLQVKLEEL